MKIGSHVVIYINCGITYDVEIGNFSTIAAGCNLSGGAVLETGCNSAQLQLFYLGDE